MVYWVQPMLDSKIDKIISILKEETKKFKEPVVTNVSKEQDPFKVLISCLLSLRTKDEVTYKASERLFSKADSPYDMIKLNWKELGKLIIPVNYWKTKSKRIIEISQTLIDNYNSKVPDSFDELMKLKGVGRKTANIVITLAFNKKAIAVDVHVNRISNRLGLIKTKNPHETEFELMKILPKKYWIIYNDLLVCWGQNICKPISPFCSKCAINNYCEKIGVKTSR